MKVDVFALGIILFIMFAGHPPFRSAAPNDEYYSLVCKGQLMKFWEAHGDTKPNGTAFFSADFMDLVNQMTHPNPEARFDLQQVMAHSWFN